MRKIPVKILKWVVDQPEKIIEETEEILGGLYPKRTRIRETYKTEFDCEGFFLGWGYESLNGAPITRAIIMRSDGRCDMTAVCLIQFDTHFDAQPS